MRHAICGILLSAAACAALLASAVAVRAETCSLELNYREGSRRSFERQEYLYWATSSQSFHVQLLPQADGPPSFIGNEPHIAAFKKIVKKEPAYQSKTPFRGVVSFGGQDYAFALDEILPKPKDEKPKPRDGEKQGEDQKEKADAPSAKLAEKLAEQQPKQAAINYTRLYFDRNRNGDLTDDEVVKSDGDESAPRGVGFSHISFPRLEITLAAGGTEYKYAFTIEGYAILRERYGYVNVQFNAATAREGEIAIAGKKRRIVLSDYNSNGLFNDEIAVDDTVRGSNNELYPRQGDVLMVDPDFDENDSPYDVTASDSRHHVSKLIVIDGKFYDVKISPSGDRLSLTPSTAALGSVTNPNKKFRALIYGDKGFLKIAGEANAPVPVPAGEWKLFSYNIDLTDYPQPEPPKAEPPAEEEQKPESDAEESSLSKSLGKALEQLLGGGSRPAAPAARIRPTLISAQATRDYQAVKVVEGRTAVLPFGPPFKPHVVVQYQRDKMVQLGLTLIGSQGEICDNMIARGGRPSKPRFSITNAKGEVVQQGNFEYG
ncbi:MAG: hypothetical protein GX594_04455 [Pirellulaceae bacterium]|nr:hypothetical protein [Pirellulaceae bacterium]